MQAALVIPSRFQEMEEGFARCLKWSNARGRNAGCVQNPIRAPCSCYKQGHKTTVDGKRTSHLFENNEESDESRKKFNTEDSSIMSPGVFPRVGW
jgi:hypothetical protein